MNINVANMQNSHLFGRSNVAGKLNIAKVSVTRIADEKYIKEARGCSVSISKEAKAMLEQLKDDKKEKDTDSGSGNNFSDIDLNSLKKNEATISFGNNKWRMLYSATFGDDPYSVGPYNLNNLSSCYGEIREEYKSQYVGEELEKHLSILDADYEDAVADIADIVKQTIINFQSANGEKDAVRKAFETLFGMNMNDLGDMYGIEDLDGILSKIGADEKQSFLDSVDVIIKFLAQRARASKETPSK